MYQPRTPGYSKKDEAMRWALPDRVSFACGACHVLAHAFLQRHGRPDHDVLWIRPDHGGIGNHIVVATDQWVFDYHGYAQRERYFSHLRARARRRWPGWEARVAPLPRDVLVSEARSQRFDGLRLREPRRFLHDALPRAERYLDRFPPPPGP